MIFYGQWGLLECLQLSSNMLAADRSTSPVNHRQFVVNQLTPGGTAQRPFHLLLPYLRDALYRRCLIGKFMQSDVRLGVVIYR